MSAGLAASTVTPGRTAPVVSFTTPATAPCAYSARGSQRLPAAHTLAPSRNRTRRLFLKLIASSVKTREAPAAEDNVDSRARRCVLCSATLHRCSIVVNVTYTPRAFRTCSRHTRCQTRCLATSTSAGFSKGRPHVSPAHAQAFPTSRARRSFHAGRLSDRRRVYSRCRRRPAPCRSGSFDVVREAHVAPAAERDDDIR
jgi:hypothetical protein